MSDELATLTLQALRRILRISELDRGQLASATGLTPSQWLVLREVAQTEHPTPRKVALALRFSQPTITALVDRLERLALVQRQRSDIDRRQIMLTATTTGQSLLARAPDALQARFHDRFNQLAEWEQAMILAGLDRLSTMLGAESLDAAPLLDSGPIDLARPAPSG